VLTARLFEQEMVGFDLLTRMGEDVYEDADETKVLHLDEPIRVQKRGPWYVLSLQLPFIDRDNLDIHRKAEELVVRVGSYKRTLILPHALQRLEVREARFVEDRLELRFGEKDGGGVVKTRKKVESPSTDERGRSHG
jgi:arsenite-transporting ATPase